MSWSVIHNETQKNIENREKNRLKNEKNNQRPRPQNASCANCRWGEMDKKYGIIKMCHAPAYPAPDLMHNGTCCKSWEPGIKQIGTGQSERSLKKEEV
jgi:hypothetical protein